MPPGDYMWLPCCTWHILDGVASVQARCALPPPSGRPWRYVRLVEMQILASMYTPGASWAGTRTSKIGELALSIAREPTIDIASRSRIRPLRHSFQSSLHNKYSGRGSPEQATFTHKFPSPFTCLPPFLNTTPNTTSAATDPPYDLGRRPGPAHMPSSTIEHHTLSSSPSLPTPGFRRPFPKEPEQQ